MPESRTAQPAARPEPWILLLALALASAIQVTRAVPAQADGPPQSLDAYLGGDRAAEIALARSAAPPAVSADATVMVLTRHGYETVTSGRNGFTCLVERSWMSPFDNPEFWDPKVRGPVCYNAAATRSVLPLTSFRTQQVLKGTYEAAAAAADPGCGRPASGYSAPEIGAMSYMMSKHQYLADASPAWHSHLMFHLPKTQRATWGADLPGSTGDPGHQPHRSAGTAGHFHGSAGRLVRWHGGALASSVGGLVLARLLHESRLHCRHCFHQMNRLVEQRQFPIPSRAHLVDEVIVRDVHATDAHQVQGPPSDAIRQIVSSHHSRVSSDGSSSSKRLANISTFSPTLPQVMTTGVGHGFDPLGDGVVRMGAFRPFGFVKAT